MEKLLEFLLQPAGAILFMLLVVPGFIALRTVESLIPGEKTKAGEAAVDIIVFSALNDGFWAIVLIIFGLQPWITSLPGLAQGTILAIVVFLSPIGFGIAYVNLRKKIARPGSFVHPVLKPWDWVFGDYFQETKQIVFTLSDGRRFGGLWVKPCFASSYPAKEQIFISQVFNVDQVTGQLIDPIPDHEGLVVDKDTVQVVEFFDKDRPFAARAVHRVET